ncbi:SpoIID/LytB domain-containing protein [Blastococcus sp. PRF04-17]|uniref:SpoIID/LytB domain-containing protein n=1 Tax=Blastococcus sp. PRF04-17 TaxID=2933797 RepID=UPI001FF2E98C|nr:SpoIID/LytB domain-containing protein [Blastococcus sp. PRF04-17]UOY01217.1 SpoIID/LytB domain-containing protein [Blastococcus sp. PRF04-17]
MLAGLLGVHPFGSASAALQGDVQISGHGYGHGRGLSQWGARGYAVDHNWTWQQILDHYYGGTVAGSAGNPVIGVELLSRAGQDMVVTVPSLTVNGSAVGAAAVLVRRTADARFNVYSGPGCGGPWTTWRGGLASGVVVSTGASPADPANHVQLCEGGQVRGYRGKLVAVDTGSTSAVVNHVYLEDYLKGVLPSEMPSSWADLAGGRGANALRAQAVAARSYAIATPRNAYATTCDTTACQVYKGEYTRPVSGSTRTFVEDSRANAAIAATAGQVRKKPNGAVSRTEFSASSGGWTTPGEFPAVQDLGDGTAGNPNTNWSVAVDAGTLAARLGTPAITGISVTERNGLGVDGGRVLRVVVDTANGPYSFTGNQFRSRVGLKSDWFKLNVRSYTESASYTKALYNDLLGRSGAPSEVAPWAGSVAGGTDPGAVARSFLGSTENLRNLVKQTYAGALKRTPDPRGYDSWVAYLRTGRTLNELNAAVYNSAESLQALGGGDMLLWVDGMYQGLLGRTAGASERQHWADVATARGRNYVAFHISGSVEARQKRLVGYYSDLLQRGVDSTGMQTWVPQMMGNGDVDVQVSITSSVEYWNKARTRFP